MAGLYHSPSNAPGEWAVDTEYVNHSALEGLTESPCKTCPKQSTCTNRSLIDNQNCPHYTPKEPIFCFVKPQEKNTGNRTKKSKKEWIKCHYEGCDVKTSDGLCYMHKKTVEKRIKNGITGDDLYKIGNVFKLDVPKEKKCVWCGKIMHQRKDERNTNWIKRQTCCVQCQGKYSYKKSQNKVGRKKKLSNSQVKAIKKSYIRTDFLAKRFGVSKSTINSIKRGEY